MFEEILFFFGALFSAFIQKTGYLGVFVLMALASCAIPIPSEAVMSFSGYQVAQGNFAYAVLLVAALAGNFAGFSLLYFIGKKLRHAVYKSKTIAALAGRGNIEKGERWVRKRGTVAVFFCAMVPLARAFIALPAGILLVPYRKFIAAALFGSLIWNILWSYAGYVLGQNWGMVEQYVRQYAAAIVIAGITLFIFYIRRKYMRH